MLDLGVVEGHILIGEAADLTKLHLDLDFLSPQVQHHSHGLLDGTGCGEALLFHLTL